MPILLPAAILGSAAIGAAASSSAASKAAKAETNAANQANQTIKDQQAQTRGDLLPYNQSGQGALTAENKLLGLGSNADTTSAQSALTQTPGYQFALAQGLKAVGNSNATRLGGGLAKGAANYATGLANSTYGDQVNRLQQVANLGENAAAQTGSLGTTAAGNISNNITAAGNAKAANQIATGNAITGVAQSVPSALIFNKLFGAQGAGASAAAQSGMYAGGF